MKTFDCHLVAEQVMEYVVNSAVDDIPTADALLAWHGWKILVDRST